MCAARQAVWMILALVLAVFAGGAVIWAQEPDSDPQPASAQAALGTAFTYQGRLTDGGAPANGTYDFQFKLYDAATGGSQVGSTVTKDDVAVSDGLFTVDLDFGSGAFDGNARWLEIGVRPGDSTGAYTTLSPRQALTATPYALFALAAPWSGLTGVPAGFADGVDDDTTYSAGTGLALSGTTFSVAPTYRLPQSCNNGQIAEWNGSQWVCGNFWSLTGNSGTDPATNFLGTTDNQALEVRVNNERALRIEPGSSPNLIGGFSGNNVTAGVVGATIAGGGRTGAGYPNGVTDNYGTVGGGLDNWAGDNAGTTDDKPFATVSGGFNNNARGNAATVGGGDTNEAIGDYATVGGGSNNVATGTNATVGGGSYNEAQGSRATLGGGAFNTASGESATVGGGDTNRASSYAATVGGGASNTASGERTTVGGGSNNAASGYAATVAGGLNNDASADYTTVGGGRYNRVTAAYGTIAGGGPSDPGDPSNTNNRVTDEYGTIGGGANNRAGNGDTDPTNARYATVGGGYQNTASDNSATVSGGRGNVASDWAATVGGGASNAAEGRYATVPGGVFNTAAGDFSFAAGRRAKANHNGTFVWADAQDADFASTADNQFLIRAAGGVGVGTNAPQAALDVAVNSTTSKATLRLHETANDYARLEFSNTNTARRWHIAGYIGDTQADDRLNIWNSGAGDVVSIAGDGRVGIGTPIGPTTPDARLYVKTDTGTAVYGRADSYSGVNYGVQGESHGAGIAIQGRNDDPGGFAGYFWGRVHVTGDFSAGGSKSFKIDHPLDPANKYLYHFAQEAPQVQNVYNGVITLDASGQAVVTLPDYFAALNTGPFRYQLTPIGAPMPNLYIAQEIQGNRFRIAGGVPGKKVSWEVTAVRHDPYLRDHPVQTEVEKPAEERGTYLYPEGYGQPKELSLDYQRNQELFEKLEREPTPSESGE